MNSNMVNLSLFDRSMWEGKAGKSGRDFSAVAGGGNTVKIAVNADYHKKFDSLMGPNFSGYYSTVIGTMMNELTYTLDSSWVEQGSLNVPFVSAMVATATDAFTGVTTAAGMGEVGSVFKSKKLWSKSGYIKLAVTMRVVDWDGVGAAVAAADQMARLCVPGPHAIELLNTLRMGGMFQAAMVGKVITPFVDMTKKGITNTAAIAEEKLGITGANDLAVKINQDIDNSGEQFSTGIKNMFEDATMMSAILQSPPYLSVSIGKYFNHGDMIIETMTQKFSKETCRGGMPLYVDFELGLSSRSIVSGLNDVGLRNVGVRYGSTDPRITVNDPNSAVPSSSSQVQSTSSQTVQPTSTQRGTKQVSTPM